MTEFPPEGIKIETYPSDGLLSFRSGHPSDMIITFLPDGTIKLGEKWGWSDAAKALIEAYGNGITARIIELETALAAALAGGPSHD